MDWRSFFLAIAVHGLLVIMLVFGLNWKTESSGPLQVELWAAGNSPVSPPPAQSKPEPPPPPKPQPKPEPVPEPPPPPPPPPEPPPPPVELPKQDAAPDIALEQEKKRLEQERAERDRIEQEKQREKKRLEEEARKEQDRIKHEREVAERKEKERLDQERKEAERKEAEKKAKEDTAKKAAEKAAEKAAAEKKEEAEKKAKEEAEKKAKEDAAKKAAAEKKAKEDAAKKAAADQALRDAFRSDALGAAGIPGGTADRNQSGGGRDNGYASKVRACIQPGVAFPTPQRTGSANPTAVYVVRLKSDGTVSGLTLKRSSGNPGFDRAVEAGISKCTPFPKPSTGGYPANGIEVNYQMYE